MKKSLIIFSLLFVALSLSHKAQAQYLDNCTQDCSGHLAGYRWAQRHNITDERHCYGGKSRSFIEGCIQYVREH